MACSSARTISPVILAIVRTHPDGHNSAGNIHVHIVIGSLRVRTVERSPFMDKPCDREAGKKQSLHFKAMPGTPCRSHGDVRAKPT